jgi:hypothetical protein
MVYVKVSSVYSGVRLDRCAMVRNNKSTCTDSLYLSSHRFSCMEVLIQKAVINCHFIHYIPSSSQH